MLSGEATPRGRVRHLAGGKHLRHEAFERTPGFSLETSDLPSVELSDAVVGLVLQVVPMAIALSARAEGIASHAGSADMGHQDTGMGMIGIISRGGIETTMIDITNPGDTHENITRPSGTSVPRIQRWSLTEFPRAWAEAIE